MNNTILENIEKMIKEMVEEIDKKEMYESIKPIIIEDIKQIYGSIPERHEIVLPSDDKIILNEVTHEKFDEILNIVALNIPVFLTGRAGTGKNVICKQIAKALNLEFYFTNAITQEYKLTGFIDANGKYQETQFYKAFTQGGLFFLDEMDASIPEVLIILNAALANGYFDFPIGKVTAHPDFRVIAAGNTGGNGANDIYTGRYALDGASLDRFVQIKVDYSKKIEKSLANENEELLKFVYLFRQAAENKSINCLFTYRAIDRITKLAPIMDIENILSIALIKDLSIDDLKMLTKEIISLKGSQKNNYIAALSVLAGEEKEYANSLKINKDYANDLKIGKISIDPKIYDPSKYPSKFF